MSEISKCNRCGAPLTPDSPEGLCPRCLIAMNLATQTEIPGETGPAKVPPVPPLPVADVAKLFPQLEILECLGRGGMGAVYKARQPRLDRLVALKILSPEKQGNQKFAERFEREARALARLHHPNIVAVFDFGEVQGNFYLLMEFVDGLTLRQVLEDRQLSAGEALAIVPKICEALQYAHEQGIVHRDIKPENILMDKSGRLKIADFGIAKILGDGERTNLTEEQAIGTPHYMSPEQIEKPQTVDHRADIYSLGVVFYEMLTGELPLGKFLAPSKKVHIDVRLDEIVLRALEKEPDRRYQHASEVKTQVETITASPSRYADDPRVPAPPVQKPDHFWRRFAIVVLLLISIPFVISILGLLAAIAIPNFVHARQHSQELQQQRVVSTSFAIGQKWFPKGDSIEITSVEWRANETVDVKGHYDLVSHDQASLAFYVTSTNAFSLPEAKKQTMQIFKGGGDFELTYPRRIVGLPHISMYADGHSFAAIYFGDEQQAEEESKAEGITNDPSTAVETQSPMLAPETKLAMRKMVEEAESQVIALQVQFTELSKLNNSQLRETLPDVTKDAELTRLLQDLDTDQIQLKALDTTNSNAGQALIGDIATTDKKINDRMQGLLFSLKARISSQEAAIHALENKLAQANGLPLTEQSAPSDLREARVKLAELRVSHGEQAPEVQQAVARVNELELMSKEEPNASPELREAKANLAELLVRDGKDNPEVQQAQARVKALEANSVEPSDNTPTVDEQPPVVVETFPVSGARDVDPGETEIRVRFSKDMMDGSWSWSTAWENSTPQFIGSPHYDDNLRTCIARVKLEPGRSYAFWLNSDNFHNFRDADGRPAVPYLLIFHTRDATTIQSDNIGQIWFPEGDSIQITSVERTENQMIVKGHYNLVSHDDARLELHITTSSGGPTPTDSRQEIKIVKGSGDFELTHPHVVPGLPHVSMYGSNGHTFATVYFGTKEEAAKEAKATWITNSPSFSTLNPNDFPGQTK
jgi:serine/threonine protein kinase